MDTMERILNHEKKLKSLCPKYEELLRVAACFFDECEQHMVDAEKWEQEIKFNQTVRSLSNLPKILKSKGDSYNPDAFEEIVHSLIQSLIGDSMALETHVILTKALASNQALKGANAVHNQKGGSRDKQEKIRTIWASGEYSSRDKCAEKECNGLGMSFSTARRALRNTPEPTSLPAKKPSKTT